MNSKQAMTQARARWGKKAAVQDSGKETSEAIRKAASAEVERLRATLTKEQQKEPANRKLIRDLSNVSCNFRYQVGSVQSIAGVFSAFLISGQGDTWEEAFARADRSDNRKAA